MIWSPQQDAALCEIKEWLQTRTPQVYHLFGYAGSGKTTLAKQIADDFSGHATFAAYTGKAALVMRQKGCRDATTIHSLIYQHRPAPAFTDEELASFRQKLAANQQSSIWERRRLLATFRIRDPDEPVRALAAARGGTEESVREWLFLKDEALRFDLNEENES